MSASITWRDALRAASIYAKCGAENSKPRPSGPSDEVTLAEKRGAAYAFNVMADELELLIDPTYNREALARIRRLLSEEHREITNADVGKGFFAAFGQMWPVADFIGRILEQDVGKARVPARRCFTGRER